MALLPAPCVPGVADLDAVGFLDDVVITRRAGDRAAFHLAHHERQHMPRLLAGERLVEVRSVSSRRGTEVNQSCQSSPSAAAAASASRCSRPSGSRRTPWPSSVTGFGALISNNIDRFAPMDKEKTRQAIDQVFRDMAGAMAAGMALVGTRTGLFRAMPGKGPLSVEDLVPATRLQHRYVEEWLKGMAAAGYLEYSPARQTYRLAEEMAYFVASDGSDHFVGGMWEMVPPLLRVAPRVAEAFAHGGGVPFQDFGPDCVNALDLINRGQYEQRFTDYWLKALPEVVERLRAGGRVLDYGCGSGRVAIAIKKAFPSAEVHGYDVDAQSIARAREAAKDLQIAFATEKPSGQFDLVTICDCIHDLAAPSDTLRE